MEPAQAAAPDAPRTLAVMAAVAAALVALVAQVPVLSPQPPAPPVAVYQLVPLPRDVAEMKKTFTGEQIALLEKLNRRDIEHLPRVEPRVPGLVAPERWDLDELSYSPMPATYEWAATFPKTLVVDQPRQVFGAYENGRLVRWGPVSTGRATTPTPLGLFNLTWRAKGRRSTDNAAWFLPWYFNFHNERGVSFHQFELPGYPASHACVRLLERDAIWVYGWGEQWTLDDSRRQVVTPGTPVLILGTFEYGRPAPWVDLASLAMAIALPPGPPVTR